MKRRLKAEAQKGAAFSAVRTVLRLMCATPEAGRDVRPPVLPPRRGEAFRGPRSEEEPRAAGGAVSGRTNCSTASRGITVRGDAPRPEAGRRGATGDEEKGPAPSSISYWTTFESKFTVLTFKGGEGFDAYTRLNPGIPSEEVSPRTLPSFDRDHGSGRWRKGGARN